MRRSSLPLAAAALTLALAHHAAQAQTEPELSIFTPTPTVSAGQSFTLDVDITGISDLYGWQLDLGFTPGVVSAGTASEGTFLATGGSTYFIPGTIDNVGGAVTTNADTLLTAVSGVNGSGVLETFDFTAMKSGVAAFGLSNVTLVDSQLVTIEASTSGANVTVKGSVVSAPEPESGTLLLLGFLGIVAAQITRARTARRS